MAAATSTPVDRILKDLQECIANIQQEFQENAFPITDDNTLLHRFCAKLEFLLQHGQKEKTTLLGTKKDYWDFFCVCLRSNRAAYEGLRFVKSKSEIKSSLGRGRGFIRFCLVHKCLADSLQHCFSNAKLVNDWYNEISIWCQLHKWTPLMSSLYEFSDVNFALSPEGLDLDIAWPTFARKVFDMQYSWQPPSRSISISSLVSQNETLGGQSMLSDQGQDCDNDELKLELAQSQTEISKLSAKLLVFQQSETEMRQRIEKLEKELQTSESQVLLKESAKSEMVFDNSLEREAVELKFSDSEKAIDLLRVQLEQKNSSIESLNSTVQSLEVKNSDLTEELTNVNRDHDCTVQKLSAMSEKVQDFTGRLETTEKDLSQVMDGKKELLSKVEKMESANENMKHLVTAMENQNQMLEQQVASLKENVFKYENDLKQAIEKNTKLKDQLAEVSLSVQDFSHQIDVKDIEIETARQKIVVLEEKVDNFSLGSSNNIVELAAKVSELESINKSLIEEKNLLLSTIESSDVKASEVQASDKLVSVRDDLEALLNEKTKQLGDANAKLQLLQNNTEKIMPFLEKHEFMIDSLKSEMSKMLAAAQKLCHDLNELMPMVHNVTKKDSKNTETSSVGTASVNGSPLQESWDSPNEQLPNLSLASETSQVLLGELDIHFFPLIRTVHRMIAKLRGLMKKQNGVEFVMNSCQNMSCKLFNTLNDYERKVITASSLEIAHNAIKGLTKEHQKLQAAEAILRYELREKRKLLTRLRQQLEVTREEWNRVKSKNVESHSEWNSLREEFAKRYKQASEESGFVEGTTEASESSSVVAETVGLDRTEEDEVSSKLSNSPDELEPVCEGAEGVNEVTVEEVDGEEPPRTRLEIMEEECQILYSSLVRSSQRSEFLVQRLNVLLSPSDHSSDSSKDSSPFPAESVENSEDVLTSDSVALSPVSDICNDGDVELNFDAEVTLSTQCLDEILLSTSQHSTDLTFVQEDASYNGHLEFEESQAEAESVEVVTDNSMRKRALEALVRRCKSERSEMECRETDLKEQLHKMELANNELKVKVTSLLQERHEASKKDNEFRKRAEFIFRHERDVSDVRVHSLSEDKTSLQKELKELKDHLSTRMEYISSLEKDLEHARESLRECQESYEQEVSSLRFQLSTEALKYERSLKNYTEQESGISLMKDKVNNQEQLIQSLEVALSEIQDDRLVEQEKQWQELEELQFMLTSRDEECIALNEEAKKAVKDLDDTKNALSQLHVQSKEQETKFKKTIRILEVELAQWKKDNEDLKRQIIKLTKDKDVLWKKTEKLSYLQQLQTADRWMDDSEALSCLICKAVFSFTLRKHHCRLCGRIFCNDCTNNWLMIASSSRKVRVCLECYKQQMDLYNRDGVSDEDDEGPTTRAVAISRSNSLSDSHSSSLPVTNFGRSIRQNIVSSLPIIRMWRGSSPSSFGAQDCKEDCETKICNSEDEKTHVHESSKMEFDVITDEEIARSLSACSPYTPHQSPTTPTQTGMQMSLTRSADEIEKAGSCGSRGEIWINAGTTYGMPILIDQPGQRLSWEFTSEPKSIVFSVLYKQDEEKDDEDEGNWDTLLARTRVQSHLHPVQGHLIAKHSGVYLLVFNNYFSRFMAKKVSYVLKVNNKNSASCSSIEEASYEE